jgi:hypothetical protein
MLRVVERPRYDRFAAPFTCPNCAQSGSATWEEQTLPRGSARTLSRLIFVSHGFHVGRALSNTAGGAQIVCDRCNTGQPD